MKWFVLMVLPAFIALGGCAKKAAPPAPAPDAPAYPTAAQPKLPTIRLWLGPAELSAEMALSADQEEAGMMFRTNMDENAGMIFVFPRPWQARFWMLNTVLPLSAAYIDPQGAIVEIHDLEPHNTNAVIAETDNIQYVLEVNQGWFKRHQVQPGAFIRTERGTLQETFFRSRQGQ